MGGGGGGEDKDPLTVNPLTMGEGERTLRSNIGILHFVRLWVKILAFVTDSRFSLYITQLSYTFCNKAIYIIVTNSNTRPVATSLVKQSLYSCLERCDKNIDCVTDRRDSRLRLWTF